MHSKLKEIIIYTLSKLYQIVRTPILFYQKKFNIQTRGVRVLVATENKVLLLKHWYNGLWVMPGGGVHAGETTEYAAIRELKEETGLDIKQLDYLLGMYLNMREGKKDTVYCYVVELEKIINLQKKFNFEVSDIAWFDFDALPDSTSQATRDRIREYQTQDIQKHIRPWS